MIYLPKKPKFFGQQLRVGHWSTKGLVFLWRGIRAGNVVDESYYGNHGTITGATWEGNALDFNGTSDYVDTGVSINTNDNWSVIGRAKVVDKVIGGNQFLFGSHQANRFYFGFDANGDYFLGYGDSFKDTVAASEVTNNIWFHFAFLGDNGTARLYINGAEVDTHAYTGVGAQSQSNLIGARRESADPWPPGSFSECTVNHLSLYNRTLSASEIAALYINPSLPMQQPPTLPLFSAAQTLIYSRGDENILPTNDDDLETLFTEQDYTDVLTDNNIRVTQSATNEFSIFLFKNKNTKQDTITLNWNGQSDIAPLSSIVYLQIFNRNSLTWETLDSNNTENADTDFDLSGVQSTNLENYFDENFWISWRVYQ